MPNGIDRNWIRLCGAIDGFKMRFGFWPTKVFLPQIILDDLEKMFFLQNQCPGFVRRSIW